jgi:hypothetical protein
MAPPEPVAECPRRTAAVGPEPDSCDLLAETRLGNARRGNLVRVFSVDE